MEKRRELEFIKTSIEGLLVVRHPLFPDDRGLYAKPFSSANYLLSGIFFEPKEFAYTIAKKGVLKGMHFQFKNPQAKINVCIQGSKIYIVVDIRKSSPTFGKWEAVEISGENRLGVYVPAGFAVGTISTSEEDSIVGYICDKDYEPDTEATINYADPDLAIPWKKYGGTPDTWIISEKDRAGMSFAEFKRKYGGV
jgi:dTDP-4-dehydrorhamnose 3,5-epimerase